MVYDDAVGGLVMFGGVDQTTLYDDTWTWNGSTWAGGAAVVTNPAPRAYGAATYDAAHGAVVMFGGWDITQTPLNDLWRWDARGWTKATPATLPAGRILCGLADDTARGRVVLFGGESITGAMLGDTWEWDGADWKPHTPLATEPPPRMFPMLTYDAARARTILFGGYDRASSSVFGDTWQWDGSVWTPLSPATSPPARDGGGMAYDPVRQRVVLFGGAAASYYLGDTWEWDGATWTELTPDVHPAVRAYANMTYDAQRQRVLLFGGNSLGAFGDTWEWDGVHWTQVVAQLGAPERYGGAAAYDGELRHLVVFGGYSGGPTVFGDTEVFEYTSSQPTERCLLSTADEDGDGLAGCADLDCWARCTPLCPPGTSCTGGPRCGDGTCSAVEDKLICPADCP
jgi:hypothetical protein